MIERFKNRKFAIVAVTRACNCKCISCDLWKKDDTIDIEKFCDTGLDKLKENGFGILQYTGGEPLLLKQIDYLIDKAKGKGFIVQLMTNGTTISNESVKKIKNCDIVSVSVDHYDDKKASAHRRFPGILKKVESSVKILKQNKIRTTSTTLISKMNYNEIEKVIDYVNNKLGIPFSLCIPESAENYKLDYELEKEKTIQALEKILEMKKRGYNILNSSRFIKNAILWLKNKHEFPCRAGKDIIYIDWNMDVYPCFVKDKICKLDELSSSMLVSKTCNNCLIQCFREPSIFYSSKIECVKNIGSFFRLMRK